ncbi:MAG: serine--tRNA ligase, partial [Candidatus Thioglobus sp.]|nr:serine--tRNA ligase [Candidatus Thioglobus sp.]
MLDSKLLRNSLDLVEDAFKKRGFEVDLTVLQKLEETRKALQSDTEKMQASLNEISKEIGKLKATKKNTSVKEKEASGLTKDIKKKSSKLDSILEDLNSFSLGLPNIPDS